jgi:hypothetical protein
MGTERTFSGYDDLLPSAYDLSQDWRKMPVLPPATEDELVPFVYAPGRQPDTPRIVAPDGWIQEVRDELLQGHRAQINVKLHWERKCGCGGKKHRMNCQLQRFCQHLAYSFLEEMEQRTRKKLAFTPCMPNEGPIMLDDRDGLAPPMLRFGLVPL